MVDIPKDVTMESLEKLQKQLYEKYGYKVDVYHSEEKRTMAVVPTGVPPTPFTALEVIRY